MKAEDKGNERVTFTPIKLSLKERIEQNLLIFFLTTLGTGFGAGYSTYTKVVETSGQVLVGKDTYRLKKDLVGPILKTEAVKEIDYLIQLGQAINNHDEKTRVWLMQVLAFIQGLNLEKDSEWNKHPMSAIEADIRYVFLDPTLEEQRQRTLGILLGFKAAFETKVTNP